MGLMNEELTDFIDELERLAIFKSAGFNEESCLMLEKFSEQYDIPPEKMITFIKNMEAINNV